MGMFNWFWIRLYRIYKIYMYYYSIILVVNQLEVMYLLLYLGVHHEVWKLFLLDIILAGYVWISIFYLYQKWLSLPLCAPS